MLAGEVLRLTANRIPAKTALICGERRIDYAALDMAADRFAGALINRNIAPGDRVAIMSRNSIEYCIAHFGCARAGAVIVNLMPAYASAELEAIIGATEAKLVFADPECAAKMLSVAEFLGCLDSVIELATLDDFLATGDGISLPTGLSPTEPLGMTFTGGTTGLPKGAVVSHACRYVSSWTTAIEHAVREEDTVGVLTPLYHAMGSMVWMPTAVMLGATAVLMPEWDPDAFIETTAAHGISTVLMVPLQLQQILRGDHFDADKLRCLTNIACGGAITPEGLVHEVAGKMPWARFTNHYGQSETGPICVYKPHHPREKADTIGMPAIGVDLKIVDEDGNEAATGEPGEIIVRGPFLMKGYFDNAAETGLYFRNGDGWGWTGDLAARDADGFIRLIGRSKDMIVSGGINIYPREIELTLEAHDAIADCTVFGVPDEKWGEALVAYVVCRAGATLTEKDVIGWCEEKLARFKTPKHVRILNAIPKTPAGKVQKPKLRDAFLAGN